MSQANLRINDLFIIEVDDERFQKSINKSIRVFNSSIH